MSRTGYVLKMYPRFSETFVVSEILAREAAGEEIVIFSLRPCTDARFHPELARVKAPVIHVGRPRSASTLWAQLTAEAAPVLSELLDHDVDDAVQAVQVARLATEHGVTHLHAHFATVATTVARLAGKIAGLPYSFTAHAKDIFHEDVVEADLAAKFADAHHAVTISGYNKRNLNTRLPASADRIHLVYNGLELERFPYAPRPASGVRLLSVGRLVEKKGLHLLVDAVAALHSRDIPVTVDIAGDGPLREDLARQIDALGLSEHVRLLGPVTQAEVTRLLGECDVFVAPFIVGKDGNADGLPTVLLEAMARGVRIVAADVTAVGEVITDETGWLVPTGDVDALVEAVADATADTGTGRADAGRALVEKLFDSTRQARALRDLQEA